MPKVELFLNQGGILAKPKLVHKDLVLNSKRNKRDLNNNKTGQRKRNRVVKKLVRVQLIPNNPDNNNLEINTESIETTTKRKRRRLKIKKKKRKLVNNTKSISLSDEDHLQQATRPRKRIIITRKRLLQSDTTSTDLKTETITSTTINQYQNSIYHNDYEDSLQENEVNDESNEANSSEESFFNKPNNDDEDITESNKLDDDSTPELVTLKESDFYLNSVDDYEDYPDITSIVEDTTEDVTILNDVTTENLITEDVTTLNETSHVNVTDIISNDVTTETATDKISNDVTTETLTDNISNGVVTETSIDNATNVVTTESHVNVTDNISNDVTTENVKDEDDDSRSSPIFQDIPEYEPYFPELTESLDAPIILLKTTVLSSIEQLTKTVVQSRLRTYTFVVTRVAGNEQIVTSTTEVKPHTKTTVITESVTRLTTLTLLDTDATKTLTNPKSSITSALEKPQSEDNQVRNYDEARNLATRIMSNGVEVIVAGNKTIPGDKDFKRLLTSGTHKPVTLKPSTLRDHMLMLVPQESSNIENLSSTLYPNQFITKTCLTTFTYLTTFLEGSTTTVSSHEQVVSNIATEERNTGKILPSPAMGVTLTQHPNLSVGVFHTTYTYLNTILDGDQPLVVSSKHTVTNTVTAPDDYLSLLKSSGTLLPVKDTNTYFTTIGLEKTLYEGNRTSVMSTREVVTQVVITESVPPRATSVMTSYIALDVNDNPDASYITTDVIKTYFVTYTYYNTMTKNSKPVVHTNISVSSDIVTEKLYIIPKTSLKMDTQSKENNFQIFTTKSYLTTFTYFTTLLQDENKETPTVVSSRTSVIENLVSETVDLSLLDKSNLNHIRNEIDKGSKSIVKTITLYNGETFEITAIANEVKESIIPSKVLPIEKTQMPESLINDEKILVESSVPNIITGSTIVFIDDDPFAQLTATPVLKNKKSTQIKKNVNSITVTDKSTKVSKTKRSTKSKTKSQSSSINPSKSKKQNTETVKSNKDKKVEKVVAKPQTDLLGLGSINIQAIAPVLNAMAGLISTNLKSNRRSDVNITTTKPNEDIDPPEDIQSRSPIYIPVRGLDDEFEIAESQNIATFEWVDSPPNQEINSHESSIISNGIPISPGDIINTNSDVIVGKPGRIGPRIPSIPLHQVTQENEIPLDMKPPPAPKNNHEYKHIPVINNFDYIGPPPAENLNEIAPVYAKNQKNYIPNRPEHRPNYLSFNENPQPAFTDNHPVYAHNYNHNQQEQQNYKPNQQEQQNYKHNQQEQQNYKHNQREQQNYKPNQQEQQNYKHNQQEQQNYKHNQREQQNYKPNQQEQQNYKHNQQEQQNYKHNQREQQNYKPNQQEQQNYKHNQQEQQNYKPDEQEQQNYKHNQQEQQNYNSNQQNYNYNKQDQYNYNPNLQGQNNYKPNQQENQNYNNQQDQNNYNFNQQAQKNYNYNQQAQNNYKPNQQEKQNYNNQQEHDNYDLNQQKQQNYNSNQQEHDNYDLNQQKQQNYNRNQQEQQIYNHNQQDEYNYNRNQQEQQNYKKQQEQNNYNHNQQDYNHNQQEHKLTDEILTIQKPPNIIKSSVIHNEPLILPEVIERSTGQPLLVNIQPSQVAFVNIPFNRTTALIYGGSTEPHKNGQYFDDPSPYPQPEFSGVEINNIAPQITSVYQPDLPNQKQVNGVIKVENQLINNEPSTSENKKIQINIQPTKIEYSQQDNQQMPPVSYGLIHHGTEFNAHVINHEDIVPKPVNNIIHRRPFNGNHQKEYNTNYRKPSHIYPGPIYEQKLIPNKRIPDPIIINNQKYFNNKKNILRPNGYTSSKPSIEISEFMSPPATPNIYTKRPYQSKRPIPIPPPPQLHSNKPPQHPSNFRPSYPIYEVHVPAIPENRPIENVATQRYPNTLDSEINDHKEDDMENEDGEVIQESNSRPLLPGQVPPEIQAIATTKRTIEHIRISNPATRPYHDFTQNSVTRPYHNSVTRPNRYQEETFLNNKTILNNQYNEIINGKISLGNKINDKNIFGIGTHEIASINENPVTTRKPILIFIDEKPESKNEFFNKNKDRPAVTSLPINTFKEFNKKESEDKIRERTSTAATKSSRPSVTSLPINTFKEYSNHERPVTSSSVNNFKYNRRPVTSQPLNTFKEYSNWDRPVVTSLPINKFKEFNNRDRPAVTSVAIDKDLLFNNVHKFGTQTEKPFSGVPSKTLYSNEIIKKDNTPPRPVPTKFVELPVATDKISNLNTEELPVTYNNDSKIISEMEIMKPPPIVTEVPDTSMQPPNPVYTVVPLNGENTLSEEMVPPPKTEEKVIGMVPPSPKSTTPRYSMEIDISTEKTTHKTTDNRRIRTRKPYNRRPGYRSTTTRIPVTTVGRKPVSTTKNIITPSPSIKVNPSLEIIIGHPNLQNEKSTTLSTNVEISSSEIPITTQKSNDDFEKNNSNKKSTIELSSSSSSTELGVHHAGNEIKVVPETTKPLPNTIMTTYNETKSKTPIPTRYITHTKTATVTITKTTVIKSLGMTPSTLTILVTKTEKTTIVDTVTEVHTLVKPTSIIETITTTLKQASSLYPNEFYGTQYPPVQVKASIIPPLLNYNDTFIDISEENENLDDFIIHDTDPPIIEDKHKENTKKDPVEDNDTILVIMTDKNTKNIVKVPTNYETPERDEMLPTNKENNVLLGGVLIANHPEEKKMDKCEPECQASRNELCQKIDGLLRCTCRPGFARMFPDRPCLPTYTFDLKLTLDRIGKDPLHFYDDLKNPNSQEHFKFVQATSEALDRMVMQSDLRDIFHGVKVHNFEPGTKGIVSKFYLQLSENMEETRLEDILKNYLLNNSFSLGGTDIFSSPLMDLDVQDFDECTQPHLHDCSENAQCFNLKGTYSCSCKEGFADLSENTLYPGRICSAEQIGCEKCNYHGTCFSRGADEVLCECFQWYTGQYCHINLKVLLIALVTLGTLLFGLLLTCIILTCVKGKPRNVGMAGGINFLHQGNAGRRNTLDRRAMIQDTSSEEDNKSETSRYVKKSKPSTKKISMQIPERDDVANHSISFNDQKDRSLTVMIPRAKYHPAPPTSPLMNYTSFDVRKPSVPSTSNEAKLLSFLDAGPSPNKSDQPRKFSNAQSESIIEEKSNSRKTSGALISAGFEVSATVVNNMGTLGTTCGTEADRSENATLIQKISADLLSSTGTRSQFNTLRKSLVDEDLESNVNDNASDWLDMLPRVMTVSEARSYDETTIPPPMKCLRTDYDRKPSSQHPNDEANTMAERDLGSTFLLPHTHLYKPDRGSDISGFESL